MFLFKHSKGRPSSAAELRPVWSRDLPGELWEHWPKDEKGEPEAPAFLTRCSCVDLQDQMLIGRLRSYGVPAVTQYPSNGAFDKVLFGTSSDGTGIYVPASLLEDAKVLLTEEQT